MSPGLTDQAVTPQRVRQPPHPHRRTWTGGPRVTHEEATTGEGDTHDQEERLSRVVREGTREAGVGAARPGQAQIRSTGFAARPRGQSVMPWAGREMPPHRGGAVRSLLWSRPPGKGKGGDFLASCTNEES